MFTLHKHLGSSRMFSGACVAHMFSLLCCVLMFCLSTSCVLCDQCCQCHLIVHSLILSNVYWSVVSKTEVGYLVVLKEVETGSLHGPRDCECNIGFIESAILIEFWEVNGLEIILPSACDFLFMSSKNKKNNGQIKIRYYRNGIIFHGM